MHVSFPLPNPSLGRTFLAAISLLGGIAVWEMAVLVSHRQTWPDIDNHAAGANVAPQEPAAEAEKKLLASLPKPTPVPSRRVSTTESRVSDLVKLARDLRDRGDTGTALTRLREAQAIMPRNPLIISEMAGTYEQMGIVEKAIEQWRRIYEIGEQAGIYYTAAEAKLRAYELPTSPAAAPETGSVAPASLQPEGATGVGPRVFSLGTVGIVADTGLNQPLRRLKLRVPILARPGMQVEMRDAVIQVYFYDQLPNETVAQTNANVGSSWIHRSANGADLPVDWSSSDPEVLMVEYAQEEPDPNDSAGRGHRKYFGYVVRVYYKGELNAAYAEPAKLINQFPPPQTLPTSDLPQ